MYNNEVKKRYIEEKESKDILAPGFLAKTFAKTKDFEEEFGKDVYDWTKDEVLKYYKYLNTPSQYTLNTLTATLKVYTQWCVQNGIATQNHYVEITTDEILSCVNEEIAGEGILTRDELLKITEDLPNWSDRFIMLALFENVRGIDFVEISNARVDAINGNKIRLCTGREIEISDELRIAAVESAKAEDYYPLTEKQGRVLTFAHNPDLIIKEFPQANTSNEHVRGRRIYERLVRALGYLGVGKKISTTSLVESGRIWYIKNELKRYDISFEDYMISPALRNKMEDRYGKIPNKTAYMKRYGKYIEE